MYNKEYIRKYLKKTIKSPYTIYKNMAIAELVEKLKCQNIIDIGCNISPIVCEEGSLRYQAENHGISYFGYDISEDYFSKSLILNMAPGCQLYKNVSGNIGNLENLPLNSNSVECLTCVDVLEHVSNPQRSVMEIARVIRPDGYAIILLPDLYKLDAFNLKHVNNRRKSSHLTKQSMSQWLSLFSKQATRLELYQYTPFGSLTGVSYICWFLDEYVPKRNSVYGKDTDSKKSKLHRDVREILSKYDIYADNLITEKLREHLLRSLKVGQWKVFWEMVEEFTITTLETNNGAREIETLRSFWNTILSESLSRSSVLKLQQHMNSYQGYLSNSVIYVFKKYA